VRLGLIVAIVPLAVLSFVGLIGNSKLAQSADAANAGDWTKAEAKARDAMRWAPWSLEPEVRVGLARHGRGDLSGAAESFRKVVREDSDSWRYWLNLAIVTRGAEQRRALAEAARRNPLGPEVAEVREALRRERPAVSEGQG
jgi:hypothetical protein